MLRSAGWRRHSSPTWEFVRNVMKAATLIGESKSHSQIQSFRFLSLALAVIQYLIYEKASHILWTTDKFVCDDDLSFRKFSAARKSSHMKKLAKVKFDVECPRPRPRGLSFWQRLMVRFPGDISLDFTITVTQADDQPPLLASTYAGYALYSLLRRNQPPINSVSYS